MISKKNLLILLITSLAVFLVLMFSKELGICPGYSYSSCSQLSSEVAEILIPIIPAIIFLLLIYQMRDIVYQAWFKFARIWIPLSMLAILVAPEYSTNVVNPIEKGTVAIFFSGIFIVVSIVIIVWKLLPKTR